jgi:chorismate mutase / prephenate dehydratase
MAKAPLKLEDVRARIDAIDRQIQALISERAQFARQVGIAKGKLKAAVDYYRPEREAHVLRMVVERNEGPLSNAELLRVFREIMSACLAQQEPLKIAYLGPEGTFTQSAVLKHFGHSVKGLPVSTIEEVFQEVEAGIADFGVVPVENSNEGAVNSTLDMFLASDLKIAGEVELKVNQNFMSRARSLDGIERVYAHAQSLAQCRGWLRKHLPKAERIAVSSNAEAARRVRNAEDAGAIGGVHAAEIYGLHVLATHIEDRADNTTRFLVIGREILSASGRDKTSLLLTVRDQPGALFHLLDPLAQAGISMTRIESRPSRQGKWDYAFFVDVEGHVDDERLATALKNLGPHSPMLKVLGSYPVAVTE